jgi:hypothetical protein
LATANRVCCACEIFSKPGEPLGLANPDRRRFPLPQVVRLTSNVQTRLEYFDRMVQEGNMARTLMGIFKMVLGVTVGLGVVFWACLFWGSQTCRRMFSDKNNKRQR